MAKRVKNPGTDREGIEQARNPLALRPWVLPIKGLRVVCTEHAGHLSIDDAPRHFLAGCMVAIKSHRISENIVRRP